MKANSTLEYKNKKDVRENKTNKEPWLTEKRKDAILGLIFVLPSFIIMMVVIIVPVIASVTLSLLNEETGNYDLSNYMGIFTDPAQRANINYTFFIVIITVILTVLISFLLALFLRFSNSKAASILEKIYILPKFIPGMVIIYTIILFVKDTGVISRFIYSFTKVRFKPGLMYTRKGIILANLYFNIPFATMMILAELTSIKDSLIESAKDIGANFFYIIKEIVIPLSKRGIYITATLVFMGNLGSFTTPFLMGTNAPRMMGVALQQEFSVFNNYPRAAAMSTVMFILSSLVGFFYINSVLKEDKWKQ